MQIQLEPHETHTIQAYNDAGIKINGMIYQDSFIVSRHALITPWNIQKETAFNHALLKPILELTPEIIILGAHNPHQLHRLNWLDLLHEQPIGIECMHHDAACRTFNILLSEHRHVVAGFIFDDAPLNENQEPV